MLIEDWRIDYNINRPHSAHGWLTPVEFVEAWLTTNNNHSSHSEWTSYRGPVTCEESLFVVYKPGDQVKCPKCKQTFTMPRLPPWYSRQRH